MAKAIISSTYDDNYFYFIPLVTWLWNRLGVEVICFVPANYTYDKRHAKLQLLGKVLDEQSLKLITQGFSAPEHKEATYAQCSRLYGACLDLPEDDILITGDVDMAVFKIPTYGGTGMGVVGLDLVPKNQVPICYIYGTVKEWRNRFGINGKTYQQCLDDLLGDIEADHFRGNYWGKDQEEAYNKILGGSGHSTQIPRARPGTQFAANRYDRDDSFLLDRLSPDTIDYHMPRPGYEDGNFNQILNVIKYHYPSDDFGWLINYTEKYRSLL